MKRIGPGSHVTLHYRLAAVFGADEREVISTFAARPATVQMGCGQLAPAIEARLLGLAEGERADFELEPGQGFGARSAALVQSLPRAAFDAQVEPAAQYAAGDVVSLRTANGGRLSGVLKSLEAERAVVDFNHPLAGLPLRLSVHVIGVI